MNDLVPVVKADVVRQELGVVEARHNNETAMSAVAAREEATVRARYSMAIARPRDVESFRVKLLRECKRPGFAELAEYSRPVGKEKNQNGQWVEKLATGPSIRLIESAIQHFGNLVVESPVIYDSESERMVRCSMCDMESNSYWSQDVVIPKRVEKRGKKLPNGSFAPPDGRTVVGQRSNSYGETTYLVVATDDEVTIKQSSLISKTQRKNGERLLPSDIIQEALMACRATLALHDAEDPDAAKRKVIDAFASQNISPKDLESYLGKPLDRMQPSDINELRGVFTGLKEGDTTWEEALSAKHPDTPGSTEAQAEIAKNKLSQLGKSKEAKVAAQDLKESPKQEPTAPTSEPEPTAPEPDTAKSEPQEPKTLADQLMVYEEKIGVDSFARILKNHNVKEASDVTDKNFTAIMADMEDIVKSIQDSKREAPKPPPPLVFGRKPGNK